MNKIMQVDGWELDVSEDQEPRASAVEIASRAGVAKPRNIKATVEKNRAELEAHGPISMRLRYGRIEKSGAIGGFETRELIEPWLNEAQAITLVALLRTPAAAQLRASLVRTFIAVRRGQLSAPVPVLATTATIGDSPIARRDVASWSAVASKACGVSVHRIHGAVRRALQAPGVYRVPAVLLEQVKGLLMALARGEMLLPRKGGAAIHVLPGGKKQQELFG